MDFSSLKNTPPMYLYLVSIISFILANLIRDKSLGFYYFLLIIGLVFFVLGFMRRLKTK
ncbi:hypothetical protein QLS91_06835 [Flavobacterium sp. LB2P84]|uniref:LPXTG cell wall anchor domain-containing protein n=1 Tax=Flavobacterium yafengii TaxID=3041253 RepID=A0AAW6TM91_9FLAO|nr:hypothetical protein [Flavobacterium yafengii]MDI5897378.1 hypothetical protein [Flavobacterium yafengii]MDI5949584.1 hypothetical protein [Flavobacterium yafengii]MDI6032785.1 hypothetical protein [Flavobacterium yafengii]MDI6045906.1 hypothetical protein [Flavobacterium yafengii]